MPAPPVPHIADSIVVGQLQTRLDGAVVLHRSSPARSARKLLQEKNFDQAPVVEDGVPIGYVLGRDLVNTRGRVDAHLRPILPHALASDRAPLDEALHWLVVGGFLFVLSGRSISGFVVPSDINKQAGRAYFFLAITALELELAEAVRRIARERDVLAILPGPAAQSVRKRLRKRQEANVEADLVAEMMLSDLFRIVGTETRFLGQMSLASVDEWEMIWKPINQLRLRVAHPTKPLLETSGEMEWLVHVGREASRISAVLAERPGPLVS